MIATSINNPPTSSKTVSHLPIKKGKRAPQTFTGHFNKVAEFFDEVEGICNERGVTDPKEMCKGVAHYCSRKIVEVIEGTQEYWDGDYEGLKREMKFMFDDQRKEVRHTTLHLIKLVRAWKDKDIKDLPTFKKFYQEYKRIGGWLFNHKKIDEEDYKLWFWAGLHPTFQDRVESRMRMDNRSLDETKAYEVSLILDTVEKIFTRKRFENKIRYLLERSSTAIEDDSDESDESDEEDDAEESDRDEDDFRAEVFADRALRARKTKRVRFRESAKAAEV